MAGFEKTAKTSRAGRFPPPRRGPRRRSRLGFLTALDAARHLLARSEALDVVDARRLRQSRDRRPCLHDSASSTAVRLLGFVAQTKKPEFPSPLAPSIQEWTPQLPPGLSSGSGCPSPPSTAWSIGHSTSTTALRRHLTPVYLQSKDQAHDHPERLTIHSSQAGLSTPHSSRPQTISDAF